MILETLNSLSQAAACSLAASAPAMLPGPSSITPGADGTDTLEGNSGTAAGTVRGGPELHETPAPPASLSTTARRALKLGGWNARTLKRARELFARSATSPRSQPADGEHSEAADGDRPRSTLEDVAAALGTSAATLCKLRQRFAHLPDDQLTAENCIGRFANCGGKPRLLPTAYELEQVRSIYVRLDESAARGRGLGSSKILAYRLVAKSDDPQISESFRGVVLKRRKKNLPPSWLRLLDTPASVLARARDRRSTMAQYVNTPRGRTYINQAGQALPLRAGTIFEADDGTFNFYAHIPWPFGGDQCSDRFGVRLGRWQLLAVVDVKSEFCPHWHVVCRNAGSFRGEDAMALTGDAMSAEGIPEMWRLERGSFECNLLRDALELCGVPVFNAWHSKQKSTVERFFDRLWSPLSLIPGHVGRDRDRFKQTTSLAVACQDGRRDPREHFLSLEAALPRVEAAIGFINSEPIESKSWGRWIPQERYETQLREQPLPALDESLRVFFSREQRTWTVRGGCVGGSVDGPLIKFPVWFQCRELWEFEGCKVKCFFEPYAPTVTGALVLQDEWRSCKPGHVIARGVPALDLPPQAVLADGWSSDERERTLAVRAAISKAVRTEARNWRGARAGEARDGLGNVTVMDRARSPVAAGEPDRNRRSDRGPAALRPGSRSTFPAAPPPSHPRPVAAAAADDPRLCDLLTEPD